MQVAFITAGCTDATYTKVLVILGMNPVSKKAFLKTLEEIHPIVENMVNEMCEREKKRIKALNPKDLGLWCQAVSSADGILQTRGHHRRLALEITPVGHCCTTSRLHRQGGALQGDIQVRRRVRCNGTVSKSKRRWPANCCTLAGCRLHCEQPCQAVSVQNKTQDLWRTRWEITLETATVSSQAKKILSTSIIFSVS